MRRARKQVANESGASAPARRRETRTLPFLGPYLNALPVWDGKLETYRWMLFSREDYGLLIARRWRIGVDGYPKCSVWTGSESVTILAHRLVVQAPAHLQCDHRDHDVLDVRRASLRLATPSQNSANTRRHKPHSSRYRGVTWHRQCGRWQAAAKRNDRCIYLGIHETEEAAAIAYNEKARELWGDFARLNNVSTSAREHAA